MILGKLVKSNSHIDYVCQVFGPHEATHVPQPSDYAFGTFVRMPLHTEPAAWLVGVIYDTVLLNPDFGRLGPRLSPPSELAVFSPDYLNEKVTLVGIATTGTLQFDGRVVQGVPQLAATTDTLVERMTDEQVWAFHLGNPSLKIAYAPLLLMQGALSPHLLRSILTRLKPLCIEPAQTSLLDLMLDNLLWDSQVAPLGGGR